MHFNNKSTMFVCLFCVCPRCVTYPFQRQRNSRRINSQIFLLLLWRLSIDKTFNHTVSLHRNAAIPSLPVTKGGFTISFFPLLFVAKHPSGVPKPHVFLFYQDIQKNLPSNVKKETGVFSPTSIKNADVDKSR